MLIPIAYSIKNEPWAGLERFVLDCNMDDDVAVTGAFTVFALDAVHAAMPAETRMTDKTWSLG